MWDLLHLLVSWHHLDLRILRRNEDGSIAEVVCAGCTCPKDANGYDCSDSDNECGDWDDYERYHADFDGPVVGNKFTFKP
jgi:hypothetical protein